MIAQRAAVALGIAVASLAIATGAALAATAYASDPIPIYSGPGPEYPAIGKLARHEVVMLAECTPSGRWCRLERNGPAGWVLGSYLIGSAAKVDATPFKPLVNPFRMFRPYHRGLVP